MQHILANLSVDCRLLFKEDSNQQTNLVSIEILTAWRGFMIYLGVLMYLKVVEIHLLFYLVIYVFLGW